MSYSFSIQAATVAEAQSKVDDELAKVVASQTVHSVDRDQASAAVASFLNLMRAPKDTENLYASVSGSVWVADDGKTVNSAGVNVSVGFTQK